MFDKEKKVQELMKKFNLNMEEIPADIVIIKSEKKSIIISKPEVMLAKMMGREVYQITGEVSESTPVSEEDVEIVMKKTGKDRDTVVKKLEELNSDLAKAIKELEKKK